MPKPWNEYIAGAEKQVDRIERIIDRLNKGFQRTKRESERNVKAGLLSWLSTAPKEDRSRENAFRRIDRSAPIGIAYGAVDRGMAPVADMARPFPIDAGAGLRPEQATNAYLATGLMVDESGPFLDTLDLPEPDTSYIEEITALVVADYVFNISGILTRDGRRIKEEMTRSVSAREPIATISNRIRNYKINESYYGLSTLQHPRAVVRGMIYGGAIAAIASGTIGYDTEPDSKWTVLPKEPHHSVQVDDSLSYRIFTAEELDRRAKKRVNQDKPGGDWKGLGLSFNTDEYYVPLFLEQEEDAKAWSKEKRSKLKEAK